MPGTISDGPSVTMSFANNFWGKDDAGVEPLIQRMVHAKQTCDELKSFYNGMFTSNGYWSIVDNRHSACYSRGGICSEIAPTIAKAAGVSRVRNSSQIIGCFEGGG